MSATILRTLLVSGVATMLAVLLGVPAGYVIDDAVVRIPWTEGDVRPMPGDRVTVHTTRFHQLD